MKVQPSKHELGVCKRAGYIWVLAFRAFRVYRVLLNTAARKSTWSYQWIWIVKSLNNWTERGSENGSENAMKRLLEQSFKLRQYNVRALIIRTGVLGVPYYDCSIM